MDRNLALFIGLLVAMYTGCTVCIWKLRRKNSEPRRRREQRRALREALLNQQDPTEHRIDAATRDASDGCEWCSYCEFANFKRLRYCALCGEKLKRTFDMLYAEVYPSTRLQRARRRKEWGRRLDLEGRAFWYRAKVLSKSRLPRGYVVHFHTSIADVLEPQEDQAVQQPPSLKVPIATMLDAEYRTRSIQVLDAATADASVFPNGTAIDLKSDQFKDVLQIAERDFPTKFSHFVVCSASLLVPAEVEVLKVSVHRDFIVEQSVHHLSCLDKKHLQSRMRINFVDESGVDAGGVHREWFMLLSELLVDPKVGLFTCTNESDQSYYLNAASAVANGSEHLAFLYATGRLVGRALLEGDVLGFHFASPLLKIMLGTPVTFDDLESVDPVAYKSMLWLLENEGVDSLGLDFTVTEILADGTPRTIELVPGGEQIPVSDQNKHEYLERRLHHALFESVSSQLYALLKGLYEVVPQHLLMLFDPEEFDFVLCGSHDIDVADWERHAKVSSNLQDSRVQRWFWEIVRDMPNEYRRRLLQFATGRSRVPLAGFQGLTSYDGRICPFTLKGISYKNSQYIRSHACFNRLDLPMYPSRDELRTVLYGILDTDIQGFTIA